MPHKTLELFQLCSQERPFIFLEKTPTPPLFDSVQLHYLRLRSVVFPFILVPFLLWPCSDTHYKSRFTNVRPLAYTLYTRWIGLILSSWCHGQVISGEIELHSETTVAINEQIINNLPNNTDILTGDYLVLCLTSGLVNGNKLRLVFWTVYVLPDLIFTHFPGRGRIYL